MVAATPSSPDISHMPQGAASASPWPLRWLTPGRCRLILVAALLLGFFGHLFYLVHDCPIDLSGDEAQYWDWSRQLELSYYSKGPLVAYIIRASCAVFGETMWAVRLPALVLAIGIGVVTYLLTLKLFRSDRIALGAVLLSGLVPMFIAGSVLMTIDPPFFFCWALATYLLALGMFDGRRWVWPAIGVVVGIGFLAKYAMFLWLVMMAIALWTDAGSRRRLKTSGPWIAVVVAMLFTAPVMIWNAKHGWVSYRHVATQTGTNTAGRFSLLNPLGFVGGQIGVIGPPLAVLIGAAVVYAIFAAPKNARTLGQLADKVPDSTEKEATPELESRLNESRTPLWIKLRGWLQRWASDEPRAREMKFLLAIGLPFLLLTFFDSLLAKVQLNWPAPAYFTLLTLTAGFVATRLRDWKSWKPWRFWVYAAIMLGTTISPLLHNTDMIYPLIRWQHHWRGEKGDPSARLIDPTVRAKGNAESGELISRELLTLGPHAFVVCDDYQSTALMAFYVAGQPRTFCAGPYFSGSRQKRLSQYDMWPDRSLDPAVNPSLVGRNAVYVGFPNEDIRSAFEKVEGPFVVKIMRHGVVVDTLRYTRGYGFKGMTRPSEAKHF